MCNVYTGNAVGCCLGGVIVATWLAMRLWTFSHMALVLYLCTSETLHILPYYGCGSCCLTYVSYGMTWDSVWGGFLFARPGVIVIFSFLITLWRGAGSRGTVMAGCCVLPLRYGGSGVCSTLRSCAGGGWWFLWQDHFEDFWQFL